MTELRTGSICSGYLGLDAAVRSAFGGETVWVADSDPDVSRLLAHRIPGVPNLGDITQVNWASVPEVDIVTAGYPCQPFSLAGKQKGMNDERNIWPSIASALGILRPRLAIFENVPNHLQMKMGFGQVTGDLHSLGYDLHWALVNACDAGAPHRRRRLFMIAVNRDCASCTVPAGDLAAFYDDGAWWDPQGGLFGPEKFEGKFPSSGVMTDGRAYALPAPVIPAPVIPGSLLPTPSAGVFNDGEGLESWEARRQRNLAKGYNGNGQGTPLTIAVQQLLPTPIAGDTAGVRNSTAGRTPGASAHSGTTLTDAVTLLLPTLNATDYKGPGQPEGTLRNGRLRPDSDADLPTAVRRLADDSDDARHSNPALLPVSAATLGSNGGRITEAKAREGGTLIEALSTLLKTPTAQLGINGGSQDPAKRRAGGHGPTLADQIEQELALNQPEPELLPSPAARDFRSGKSNLIGTNARPLSEVVEMLPDQSPGISTTSDSGRAFWDWKQYHPAILRWERVLNRPCPHPVEPGKRSGQRLSAPFVEWMMDVPPGWVTAVPGLSRDAQLKILGNGVVPRHGALGLWLIAGRAVLLAPDPSQA